MQQEKSLDLVFPANGLDLRDGNETSNLAVTREGVNVRLFEALTGRGRGGSRPGIAKFIFEQVNGEAPVSHLVCVVRMDSLAVARATSGSGFQLVKDRPPPPLNPPYLVTMSPEFETIDLPS